MQFETKGCMREKGILIHFIKYQINNNEFQGMEKCNYEIINIDK